MLKETQIEILNGGTILVNWSKSRKSDFSVSHGTKSNWDFDGFEFRGISRYKFKLRFWFNLNLQWAVAGLPMIGRHSRYMRHSRYVLDVLLICYWYIIDMLVIFYSWLDIIYILLIFSCILGGICNSPARRFQKRTLCSRCIWTPLTLRSAGSWLPEVGTVTSRSMIWTRAFVWRIRAWRGMRAKCVHSIYTYICIYII